LIVWAVFPSIPWRTVFNASGAVPLPELHTAVAICITFFLLEFPARAASAVYYGSQRGYIANGWSILGSVASLGALFLVTRGRGGLPEVILALWGVRVLVAYLASACLYCWQQPWLLPVPWVATRRAFRRLASLGVRYVVAQFGGFAMFQSHPIIIAQLLGPTDVAVFGVAYRVATFPAMIVAVFLSGLMPAYGEARVRSDWRWIQRTFRLSAVLGALVSLGAAALVIGFLRPIVHVWVGSKLVPSVGLAWALGSYVLLSGLVGPASVMLYGVERVGRQALIAVANGLLVVLLGVLFTPLEGVTGWPLRWLCSCTDEPTWPVPRGEARSA
jgi:O-antigen/teichoic acid export membrane protein